LEEGVLEEVAVGEAVVEFVFGDVGDVLGDGFAFIERSHAGVDVELDNLDDMFLLREGVANQADQTILRVIIELWRDLQQQ
jgi:hypothetical protein